MYIVYYLYSKKISKGYIGKTNNLPRRLTEHNRGKSTFTKKGIPWKLVGFIKYGTSLEASRTERKLKKAKNSSYIQTFFQQNGVWSNDKFYSDK